VPAETAESIDAALLLDVAAKYRARLGSFAGVWAVPSQRLAVVLRMLDAVDAIDGIALAGCTPHLVAAAVDDVHLSGDGSGAETSWLRVAPLVAGDLARAFACSRAELSDDELRLVANEPVRPLATLVLRASDLPADVEALAGGWSEADCLVVRALRDAAARRLSADGYDTAIRTLGSGDLFDPFECEVFSAGLLSRSAEAGVTLTLDRYRDLAQVAMKADAQRLFQTDDEDADYADLEPSPLVSLLRERCPEVLSYRHR
jgi:hypothetical protein